MINYNLRILSESNHVLESFVQSGILTSVDEQVPGTSGTVYEIKGVQPEVLSHFDLRLGQSTIQAQLYALPPEEYAGLLAASPAFTQYQVEGLLQPLSQPMNSGEKDLWLRGLAGAIRTGKLVSNSPSLLLGRQVTPAAWLPERTRIFQNGSGWFASLYFEQAQVEAISGIERSAVGIDVGLNTLAVAVHQSGLIQRAAGITEICAAATQLECWFPRDRDAQREMKRHLLLLQYAAARLGLQQMVRLLLSSASFVYFENLRYGNCSEGFALRSRQLGLRDFLMCWLPKRLDAAGIRWQRVPPDHTSRYCHLTHIKGSRDSSNRQRFFNGNGDIVDADVNAAHNIIAVGMAYRMERGL